MKMAKQTLNTPEWVGHWLLSAVTPAGITQQILKTQMPIWCQTFQGWIIHSELRWIKNSNLPRVLAECCHQLRNHCTVNEEEKSWFLGNLTIHPIETQQWLLFLLHRNMEHKYQTLRIAKLEHQMICSGAKMTRIWMSLRFEIKTVVFLSPIWQIIVPY